MFGYKKRETMERIVEAVRNGTHQPANRAERRMLEKRGVIGKSSGITRPVSVMADLDE